MSSSSSALFQEREKIPVHYITAEAKANPYFEQIKLAYGEMRAQNSKPILCSNQLISRHLLPYIYHDQLEEYKKAFPAFPRLLAYNAVLDVVRSQMKHLIESHNIDYSPTTTGCFAISLLGLGECAELGMRALIELQRQIQSRKIKGVGIAFLQVVCSADTQYGHGIPVLGTQESLRQLESRVKTYQNEVGQQKPLSQALLINLFKNAPQDLIVLDYFFKTLCLLSQYASSSGVIQYFQAYKIDFLAEMTLIPEMSLEDTNLVRKNAQLIYDKLKLLVGEDVEKLRIAPQAAQDAKLEVSSLAAKLN